MNKTLPPEGFTAVCQCGKTIGAMDITRTEQSAAGQILGKWLFGGCTVIPFFSTTFRATIEQCACNSKPEGGAA